jgi:aspartokinase/homoserine dehydrogenase 1
MKILKFGGKSLGNGKPIKNAIEIIKKEHLQEGIAVVVSARGNSTDLLVKMYELASTGNDFDPVFNEFVELQDNEGYGIDLEGLFNELKEILYSVRNLKITSTKLADRIVSFGEILSAKLISHILCKEDINAEFVDARNLLKTKNGLTDKDIDCPLSEKLTQAYFKSLRPGQIPIITGFIASDEKNETVTLGRNGSNLTTSLIANFINAKEVQNWTDVSGVYTASPKYVPHAQLISRLSYKEAHELANFGASILHPKTIDPLMSKGIPLKIYNSIEINTEGTTIDSEGSGKGIKAVSVVEDVALISIESTDMAGKIGIDGRIFSALGKYSISVRLISQASSEQGIGFVVDVEDADKAKRVLEEEFSNALEKGTISKINVNTKMAIIAILGRHNYSLEKAIYGLRRNKIWMHLISNSISGDHISLVIENSNILKAVNVVHNHVFGAIKTVNLFAFGKGTVGGKLLDQILETSNDVTMRRNLQINIIGIADSKRALFEPHGVGNNWRKKLAGSDILSDVSEILNRLEDSVLENIIIADNTTSQELADHYPEILDRGFDIVASNKKANSGNYSSYQDIRSVMKRMGRMFFYETNVGAGLPLIDTLRHLQDSADNVQRVRGVFSGSLSYIFNTYSVRDAGFSNILLEAKEKELTEPDPREDLTGMDVARKLIILARELGLQTELEDVVVQNLIPEELEGEKDYDAFIKKKDKLDEHFANIKRSLKKNEVLRFVGDLNIPAKKIEVSLVKVPLDSPLGNLKDADALFEIYTVGYGDQPIVIMGAGAGGEVTARGVYSDLLRIGSKY